MNQAVAVDSARRRPFVPFKGDVVSRVGAALLLVLLGLGLLQPILPLGSTTETVGGGLSAPSTRWLFGTDELGRSVLPRVAEGIRETVLLSTVAVLAATVSGVLLACFATYAGGKWDEFNIRVADVMFGFPVVLVAILMSAVAGPGPMVAIVAIFMVTLPTMIRVVRAAVVSLIERDFIVAAEIAGATRTRVVVRHLLPNLMGIVVVQAAYSLSLGMLLESGISFLGLGVQPPSASLGSLVGSGRLYITTAPYYMIIPGIALALAVLGVNLVGDGLQKTLDRASGGSEMA